MEGIVEVIHVRGHPIRAGQDFERNRSHAATQEAVIRLPREFRTEIVDGRPRLIVRRIRSQWLPEQQGMITLSANAIFMAHLVASRWLYVSEEM